MKASHERKFLPVGHGAFFIERLFVEGKRGFTAVYDCGDSKAGELVKKFASQEFGPESAPTEKIDILFISHFDKDHVSGLRYLQPYLTKRTRVFLPFYYPTLQSVYDSNKRVGIEEVISVLSAVSIKPILVRYRGAGDRESEIDVDQHNFDGNGNVIESGQPLIKKAGGKPIWRYVPFNLFNEEKHYKDFESEVVNHLHWSLSKLEDPKSWTKKDISDLKGVYSSIDSLTINDNSLLVLSDRYVKGRTSPKVKLPFIQRSGAFPFVFTRYAYLSCLYTGDSVLKRDVPKWSKYCDCYEDFLMELHRFTDNLALMQVPHHGSGNNINMAALCDCFSLGLFSNYSAEDVGNKVFFLKQANLQSVWKTVIGVTEDPKTLFVKKHSFTV